MAENKMADVAKLLGVELNEEFEVDDYFYGENDKSTYTYRLTEDGLQTFVRVITCNGGAAVERWERNDTMLRNLIRGDDRFNIVRKPWKPKVGETFWALCRVGDRKPATNLAVWYGSIADLVYYKNGCVYRTSEECERNLKRDYERLTGEKWQW